MTWLMHCLAANWQPLEGLRYAIWCPIAHSDISAETPQAHRDSSGMDLAVRNYGKSHFPVEGFILNGAQKLCIHVRTPQDMGLDMQMFRPADQERHNVFFRDRLDGWCCIRRAG
jgi:hypothetical protein